MTNEDMREHIEISMEFDDEELLEAISASEADLKNGKRIIPAGPTTEQIKMYISACREEAERRGLKTD